MTTPQSALKIKRIVWTGAIASVTIVGTISGARLKTQGEYKEQIRKFHEAPLSERITHLEEQRGVLIAKKMGLERKIEEVEMRRNGATVAQRKRGMERKRGESVGVTMEENRTPRVTKEDNLRAVGMGAEAVEEEKGRERKRGWW